MKRNAEIKSEMRNAYELVEESSETDILQFRDLLDDDVANATEARDNLETETCDIHGVQRVVVVRYERSVTSGSGVHCDAEHQQVEEENAKTFEKLSLGERLPFLFQQPLNDAAVQHVQMFLFSSVQDNHKGGSHVYEQIINH